LKNDYYLAAMPIVAPSLLSANFLNLQADCDLLNKRPYMQKLAYISIELFNKLKSLASKQE